MLSILFDKQQLAKQATSSNVCAVGKAAFDGDSASLNALKAWLGSCYHGA